MKGDSLLHPGGGKTVCRYVSGPDALNAGQAQDVEVGAIFNNIGTDMDREFDY